MTSAWTTAWVNLTSAVTGAWEELLKSIETQITNAGASHVTRLRNMEKRLTTKIASILITFDKNSTARLCNSSTLRRDIDELEELLCVNDEKAEVGTRIPGFPRTLENLSQVSPETGEFILDCLNALPLRTSTVTERSRELCLFCTFCNCACSK